MNEKHLEECLQRLNDTRTLLDRIQTDLRGAQEFRDAVFDLLEGTPFGAQADSTYDGLYGRLRAAIGSPQPPSEARKDGIVLIAAERARQQLLENWTPEHDDAHCHGERWCSTWSDFPRGTCGTSHEAVLVRLRSNPRCLLGRPLQTLPERL